MRGVNFLFFLTLSASLLSCTGQNLFGVGPGSEQYQQVVTYNNKIDLLWVVDTSRSMSRHQRNLANQFGSFIDVLNQKKIDYRIAITTMDMGSGGQDGNFVGSPKVITSSMPNAKALFQSNINIGESGSDLERGLEASAEALTEKKLNGGNAGFLRDDAFLAIIYVTNEDDWSGGSVNSYLDYFTDLKGLDPFEGTPLFMANFIGITQPNNGCSTSDDVDDPGDRYMALVDATNGKNASICSDTIARTLENVRARIVEKLTVFYLTSEPILGTIRVFVNGLEVQEDSTNGWSYDEELQAVRFHGNAVPAANALIQIDYDPYGPNI